MGKDMTMSFAPRIPTLDSLRAVRETFSLRSGAAGCELDAPATRFPAVRGARLAAKRAIDLAGAGLGLLLLSPLLLAIAAAIRLESRGSALFFQRRLGLRGRPFWVCKFRTMTADAETRLGELEHLNESQGGVLFKIRRDPRVTRVGRLLRRTSLDELPQLFNILQGHMSLVGPRPLPLRDCELMKEQEPDRFVRRLSVPPGLTGPWQVGDRSDVGFQAMLDQDIDYVENWSLGLDLVVIIRTVAVVLVPRGAY
jgi:lipopolysaccharide/colanic/teichoic acid biosynthesis glycosyltransferase